MNQSKIFLIALSLLVSGGSFAQSSANTSGSPMPREYRPNDGTSRAGTPGSFTSPDKQEEEHRPGDNIKETKGKKNSQVLDPSTTPDSYRVMPDGDKVRLEEEE